MINLCGISTIAYKEIIVYPVVITITALSESVIVALVEALNSPGSNPVENVKISFMVEFYLF